MIGILLVSHGRMAEGMKESCEMITGVQDNLYVIPLTNDGVEFFSKRLEDCLNEMVEKYEHVVVLADLINATPYLQAYKQMANFPNLKLISGMNLPVLLTLVLSTEVYEDFDTFIADIVAQQTNLVSLFIPEVEEEFEEEL